MVQKKTILPFDMSLRLWSDDVAIEDIAVRSGLSVDILHTKGKPIVGKPPIAGRLAKKHYASLAHAKATTFAEVTAWLRRTVMSVRDHPELVQLLERGDVEALFWVAMFGQDPEPTPALDAGLVSSIARVHAQALIENYTIRTPDCPTKTWFARK